MNMSVISGAGVETGNGSAKISVAKAGLRNQLHAETLMGPMNMVTLCKAETPDLLYRINDQAKTYSEIDLSQGGSIPPQRQDAETYQIKRLGEEKLLGYKTMHLLISYKNASNEVWATKELLDSTSFDRLLTRPGKSGAEELMSKALKDAGVDGMPLKSILWAEDGSKTTMEAVKIEKKTLPGWTFEIPAGYEKTSPLVDAAGDARAQMEQRKVEDVLKKLPQEQRAMLESALKQRQQQQPPK